jgi:hypothetical protein
MTFTTCSTTTCLATTRKGVQCTNKQRYDKYCGIHKKMSLQTASQAEPQREKTFRELESDVINDCLSVAEMYDPNIYSIISGYIYEECTKHLYRDVNAKFTRRFGEIHGEYLSQDENGFVRERTQYLYGKRHGLSERWSNVNVFVKCNYVDGEVEGVFESWLSLCGLTKDFLDYSLHFKNGKKDGLYQEWDHTGKLTTTVMYKDDVVVKRCVGQ